MLFDRRGNAGRKLKKAGLILGALFIIWLPIEDTDTRYVIPLAAGLCAWLGARFVLLRREGAGMATYGSVGLLAGLVVSLAAVALISFKGGLHAHGFPDFALVQVRDVLISTPWWAAAGLLTGLATGWWVHKTTRGS
jgi:hypothetical protein